ncbi:MAG: phosphoribosyl-AMP cyclohydrolase [Planctomycetota bacterium]
MTTTFRTSSAILAIAAASYFAVGCATSSNAHEHDHSMSKVTKADVIAAQQAWGEGIVAISKVHSDGGDFEARATEHINELYAYGMTDVMFKPTLAAEDQFRETFDEALSYFIGADGTEDKGFAISGWTNVRWESNGIYVGGNDATAMGNYYFKKPDGSETKVEYTFGYVLDEDGNLRINLHHSSLPFSPS